MPLRFYMLPVIRNPVGATLYSAPKYFGGAHSRVATDAPLVGVSYSYKDYGIVNYCLLIADVSAAQNSYLTGMADVSGGVTLANLDNNLTVNNKNAIAAALETALVPAQWVAAANTWRDVVRGVLGIFQFMQHVTEITLTNPFDTGVSLNATFGSLPQVWQDAIILAANELHLSTQGLTSSTTVRQILKNLSDQYAAVTFLFGTINGVDVSV